MKTTLVTLVFMGWFISLSFGSFAQDLSLNSKAFSSSSSEVSGSQDKCNTQPEDTDVIPGMI